MITRAEGWEVWVRDVIAGDGEWRPMVFWLAVMTDKGPGIGWHYLDKEGGVQALAGRPKLRWVGVQPYSEYVRPLVSG